MIRTAWAFFIAGLSTFFHGCIVFTLALFGVRGEVYATQTRRWASKLLWGANSRVRIHGIEKVDWDRPHVLVANHVGSFEILALGASIPTKYHFVAKKELERIPFFGRAWRVAGHISIDRSNRQKAVESLREAGEVIRRDGGIIVIFPEGTRSPTGELQPFKKGAFQLAVSAGVPIIPTIVTGSEEIMGSGSLRVTPGTMDLYFEDPIPVTDYSVDDISELMEVVHTKMREMLDAARGGEALAAGVDAGGS